MNYIRFNSVAVVPSLIALSMAFFCAQGAQASLKADSLSLSVPGSATLALDQNLEITASVHIPAGTTGSIALSVDVSALHAGASDATVSTEPAVLQIPVSSGDWDAPFKIHFHTLPGSHSFKSLPVVINAQIAGGNSTLSQTLLLSVSAIYEIDLGGGKAPEAWSSPMTLSMPKHDGGVTIRFINMDTTDTHTIHGEGAIPHQEGDPLAEATATQPGGVYEINVPSGDPVMGYYRCHDHETEDMLRSISFNN